MSTPSRWDHFSADELRCRCGCGGMLMDERFMERLVKIRKATGVRMPISSGYRCPIHDAAVGSSSEPGRGPHTLGRAVDILIAGEAVFTVMEAAIAAGFRGFGLNQEGAWGGRFLHVDDIQKGELPGVPRPRIWTY